jgi:hypothetical protein
MTRSRNRYRRFGRSRRLHPAEFGSFVAIVNRPETAGRWRLAPTGMTKGSSATAIQLSPRRRRAVRGTWPRRPVERGQSDRLFLSQARRLQIRAGLVRARAEARSEPCTDVAALRLWHIEHGNRDQAQENAVRPGIAAGPYFFL